MDDPRSALAGGTKPTLPGAERSSKISKNSPPNIWQSTKRIGNPTPEPKGGNEVVRKSKKGGHNPTHTKTTTKHTSERRIDRTSYLYNHKREK